MASATVSNQKREEIVTQIEYIEDVFEPHQVDDQITNLLFNSFVYGINQKKMKDILVEEGYSHIVNKYRNM